MSKMLIVYYSWSNGNTKKIAEELQKATGADLARIDTLSAYKNQSYDEVVRESEKDIAKGYKPELAPLYFHLKDYDTVAVGTPYLVVYHGSGHEDLPGKPGFHREESSLFFHPRRLARPCPEGYGKSL